MRLNQLTDMIRLQKQNQHPHDPQSIYTQTHQLDGYGYPSAAGQQIAL
jgi:hypothetical protein